MSFDVTILSTRYNNTYIETISTSCYTLVLGTVLALLTFNLQCLLWRLRNVKKGTISVSNLITTKIAVVQDVFACKRRKIYDRVSILNLLLHKIPGN